MRAAGGLVIATADRHAVPAGSALAIDRVPFSAEITARLEAHPLVTIERAEVAGLPPADWSSVIVATGPLTSPALADAIRALTDESALAFFDAIAPIVHFDTVDLSKAWFQSRYDKGETEAERTAYLNCPMDRAQYEAFIDALLAAEKTEFKDWEQDTPYFEGCLPIEVMAERGRETLRYGPLKPVGLTNPHAPDREAPRRRPAPPRQRARHPLQHRRLPDQDEARRANRGLPHHPRPRERELRPPRRHPPQHLPQLPPPPRRRDAPARPHPRLRFAGQITGVEGYVESAAMGLLAGRLAAAERLGRPLAPPPATTAMGALLRHITGGAEAATFQPMNVNFGLFPPLADARAGRRGRRDRYKAYTDRAKADFTAWLTPAPVPA